VRGCAGSLDAGIGVGFIIIADIENILAPLPHAGNVAETDIKSSAVSALSYYFRHSLDFPAF
jgi:hypothetical protein